MHGAILERRFPHRRMTKQKNSHLTSHSNYYKLDSSVCFILITSAGVFICVCMCVYVWFEVGRTKEDCKSWLISLPQLCVIWLNQSLSMFTLFPTKRTSLVMQKTALLLYTYSISTPRFFFNSNKNKNRQTLLNLVSFFFVCLSKTTTSESVWMCVAAPVVACAHRLII